VLGVLRRRLGLLVDVQGGGENRGAVDGEAVASGGLASDTGLLPFGEEDDEQVSGLGRRWSSPRRGEERIWAKNGPGQGRV
jgi:hypothetical protein